MPYWCLAAVYDMQSNRFADKKADANHDGRISHKELCEYSYLMIYFNTINFSQTQHVVCYPSDDEFIDFEDCD